MFQLLTRLRSWTRSHFENRHRDESSNSFVLMLVALPVLISAFGLGIDMAHLAYTRQSIKSALETAVTSGAAVTRDSSTGTDFSIQATQAENVTRQVYATNRLNGPGLTCSGSGAPISGSQLSMCWTEPKGAPVVNQADRSVTYTVTEKVKTFFLSYVGIHTETIKVTATTATNLHNE